MISTRESAASPLTERIGVGMTQALYCKESYRVRIAGRRIGSGNFHDTPGLIDPITY